MRSSVPASSVVTSTSRSIARSSRIGRTWRGARRGGPYCRRGLGGSDGLPGLVLDRYGDVIVGQIATRGMETLRKDIEDVVRSVLAPRGMYWKNDSGARDLEQLDSVGEVAFGGVPRGARHRGGRAALRGAARPRPENRLVLRPGRHPRAARPLSVGRRARARR